MEQLAEEPQETSGRPCHVNVWKKDGSMWSWMLYHGMVLLLYSGKTVSKGALQNFGSHEVLNLHRYVMLPGKGSIPGWCYTRDSAGSSILPACSLLHMFFVCLLLLSLGPVGSQWRSVALIFERLKHLTSHLSTFQGLHFFLMAKFPLWSWKWSALCVQFS